MAEPRTFLQQSIAPGLRVARIETRHAADVARLFATSPDFERWGLASDELSTVDGARAWIGSRRDLDAQDLLFTCCVVGEDGSAAGLIGLEDIQRRSLSAGFWGLLSPAIRGGGPSVTVTRWMLDYGFSALGLERIHGRCALGNVAARKAVERAGMVYEGIHRAHDLLHGRFHDVAVYAVVRSEWSQILERASRISIRRANTKDAVWIRRLAGAAPRRRTTPSPPTDAWVVEERGVLETAIDRDGGGADVIRFAIASTARGSGVGRALFDTAVNELRHDGVRFLRTSIHQPSRHHLAFLERRGFSLVAPGLFIKALVL